MRRNGAWRSVAVVWAVLQFALPGIAVVADARLERESLQAGAHVESGSTKACRAVHPDECALCQVVSRIASAAEAPVLPEIAAVVRPSASLPVAQLDSRAAATAELPRAPPSIV